MKLYYFFVLFCLVMFSCNSSGNQEQPQVQTPQVQTSNYPVFPAEKIQELINVTDAIDLQTNEGVSMSVTDQGAKQNIAFFTIDPVTDLNCPSTMLLFPKSAGNMSPYYLELHLGVNCAFYKVYENGKPTYANMLHPQGAQFFRNQLAQLGIQIQ